MSLYKRLYKINSDGKTIQQWEIHGNTEGYWTISGHKDGKKTQSGVTIVAPKANRSFKEQIKLEMDSKISQKMDKRYVENVEDVESAEDNLPGFSPMLAKDYKTHKNNVSLPLIAQPKLDGGRMLAMKEGMFTRGRKEYTSCNHIWKELQEFFRKFPDARLDGELYCHKLHDDFDEIMSLIKKTSKHATDDDLKRQEKIEYWIYDCPRIDSLSEKDPFINRFNYLRAKISKFNFKHIKILETVFDVKNESRLFDLAEKWTKDGYEGAIIRDASMCYVGSRSGKLLKLKTFDDDEFEIVGFNEGNGDLAGSVGSFTLVTKGKQEFGARMVGSFDRLKYLFNHPKEFMNKMATVRFFGYTTDNYVPRFPVLKAIKGMKDRSDWI